VNNPALLDSLIRYSNVTVNCVGRSDHPADWDELKSHPDYDLWLIVRGSIGMERYGSCGRVSPGDVVVHQPGLEYRANALDGPVAFRFCHFGFSLGANPRVLGRFRLPWLIPAGAVRKETQGLIRAMDDFHGLSLMAQTGGVMVLLARILEYETLPTADSDLEAIAPVLRYVQDNLDRSLTVDELAEVARMSPSRFFEHFRGVIGLSPAKYVKALKMRLAAELLMEKRHSIKEIAFRLGYPDQFVFSKTFKKWHHVPPSRFGE
jgi:AraC family transcriptional regulator